jgi:two-component sensor histidine kinase
MSEIDETMRVVAERLESLDRVWDLITNSEAADQDTVAISDLREVITTLREPS